MDLARDALARGAWDEARAAFERDLETALRGVLSAGPAGRAIELAGEKRVRAAVEAALAPYRLHAGAYRLENRFRYVVFGRCGR